MHYKEDERDPFEAFGALDAAEGRLDASVLGPTEKAAAADAGVSGADTPRSDKIKTAFSWAGFGGGLAALAWLGAASAGIVSYYGWTTLNTMAPLMQAWLGALVIAPAALFWLAAAGAAEALKTRRLAAELTRIARETRAPFEAGAADAQRLSASVKSDVEALSEAVGAALERLEELEQMTRRNTGAFADAVEASRDNMEAMSAALAREREALGDVNCELRGQTEAVAHSVGRQVRLLREASKLVKSEMNAAEDALEAHLAAFAAAATQMGERTSAFHHAADEANASAASLNGTMSSMLDGLSEATRLTDAAKQSSEQAMIAAHETSGALRETTRSAVFEAKRAAQLIRAETQAMQDTANDTLAKLRDAADAARAASEESQAAADRHAGAIEKRFGALTAAAGARKPAPAPEAAPGAQRTRPRVQREAPAPERAFKGLTGWNGFSVPSRDDVEAANDSGLDLVEFGRKATQEPDTALKDDVLDLLARAGVDLDHTLVAGDLDHIARSSRAGASARRRAVRDVAQRAVTRIARHVERDSVAQKVANDFRARPDLARKEPKSSEVVRAYLLIDAALA